jgi:hypothetical protein
VAFPDPIDSASAEPVAAASSVDPPNYEDRAANTPVLVRIPDVGPPEKVEDRKDNCYWADRCIRPVLVNDRDRVVLEK